MIMFDAPVLQVEKARLLKGTPSMFMGSEGSRMSLWAVHGGTGLPGAPHCILRFGVRFGKVLVLSH